MKFKEPVNGEEFEFKLIPLKNLKVGGFQRPPSSKLTKDLEKSMVNSFIGVLIVVETEPNVFDVIDGQHRLIGLRSFLSDEDLIPCIIVSKKFKFQPLLYNVEKPDNTKDLCEKIWKEYEYFVEVYPDVSESEIFEKVTLNRPYLLSLAYAYKSCGLKSPSLVEVLSKKLDNFLNSPLKESREERILRGTEFREIERIIEEIVEPYGIRDFMVKKSLLAKTSMKIWGRKRIIEESFYEGIELIKTEFRENDWEWLSNLKGV